MRLGRKRSAEPEPAQPAPPRPQPAVNGGLRFAEPPAPAAVMPVRGRAAADHVPAIAEGLRQEFENKAWGGGSYCEMLPAVAADEVAPPPPQPFQPDPPPWADALERGDFDLAAALTSPPPAPQPMNALAAMKLASGEDEWPEFPGPPVHLEPIRYEPPEPPNWEQEAAEQAERDRAERERLARQQREAILQELLEEIHASNESYPARKGRP